MGEGEGVLALEGSKHLATTAVERWGLKAAPVRRYRPYLIGYYC